ncbi:MAG TPA: 2OG-Fe(II) oxygenase [Acidimicrobiales bacterium]|nr:2OG-Fe(II) oxygenase [Acidimicrobiales bacterium]
MSIADYIDLGAAYDAVDSCQHGLRTRGVSVLPGFVPADLVGQMVAECDELSRDAYHQDVLGTPYLERPSPEWPDGHPRRATSRSSVRTVGYDQFPAMSVIRALFEWDDLMTFLGRVLGREPLYRYADPIGALNVAVMTEGDELGWHYDQTDFVVSLAIQSSESGGDFENVALVRSDDDENYDEVAAVLDGRRADRVTVEPMTPGTLMLFEGRRSLHRVTPVSAGRARYVALFGYDTRPDTMSSDVLKQTRYGRTRPLNATR